MIHIPKSGLLKSAFLLAAALALCGPCAHAQFTVIALPALPATTAYPSFQPGELPDGRLIYGTQNSLYEQGAFGGSSFASFNNPQSWDPSSITVYDATHAAIGSGTGSASSIYLFNPSNLATAFTAVPLNLQNYTLAYRDATSLYVGGTNGTGGAHAISYLTTSGTNKVIVDKAGAYSGGFALDLTGNLYAANAEDGKLYKFSKAQIDAAIAGSALNLTDGTLLTTLDRTGSIAVDALGRIWSGGYNFSLNGFDVYNPATGQKTNFSPTGANANYVVSTFTTSSGSYIGFTDSPTGTRGAALNYGYATIQSVPEASGTALAVIGLLGLGAKRRRAQ